MLARLLFAKPTFPPVGLRRSPAKALRTLFASRDGQRALDVVLAEFRKAGLSSEVADVSICGAVHPYNELLAGKLVTLLLTSQEVRDAYARRYGGQISIIASQMAGRPIRSRLSHFRRRRAQWRFGEVSTAPAAFGMSGEPCKYIDAALDLGSDGPVP